jgi:tetratricopeptide (TPR) repeat protein
MQFRAGRADDAIVTARAVLAADPRNHAAARILVLALVDRTPPVPERIAAARAALESLPADAPAGTRDLLLGRILLAEGDAHAAVEHLAAAAVAMPSDPDARLCHGEALFRAGERDAGLAELRAAAALPGASPTCAKILASRLASAAQAASQPRTAEALAREALGVEPTNAIAGDVLAYVLERRGEFRAAAEIAERILAGPGLDAAASLRLRRRAAAARLGAGDTTQAFEHIDALEKSGEAPVVAAEFRGAAFLHAGRVDEAAREFANAMDDVAATRVSAIGLAETALRKGDRKGAAAAVERWRARHSDDRDVGLAVSRMLVAQGGLDEAAAVLANVVAAHPADQAAAATRIEVLARLGRPAEAVAEARRYETAAPADDRPHARLLVAATLVNHGGAPADGLEIARAVASSAGVPDDVLHEAWAVESEALLGLGRTAAAETSLARITRSWRDDSPVPSQDGAIERRVRFVRGVLAAGAGRLPDAAAEFRRCIALDPIDLASQNNLAWVLCKSPDTAKQAVALTLRITALAPSNADYWDTRGQAARAAGDVADAETSWVRALDLMRVAASMDRAAFGATGMRLAKLCRDSGREDAAKKFAREVGERAKGTPHADAARAFLGE